MTRYPLQPLATALGANTDRQLAERCGVTTRTIERWRAQGIPAQHADRLACVTVGVHPATIWPQYLNDAA